MTSIEIHRPAAPLPDKLEYARALAAAGMIPRVYQQAPANVLVAVELGEALGIPAIVAINEINVINGTPAPSASLMASLARSAGHRVRTWNEDDGTAVCEIVRTDDPEFTHRARWDEAKARKAGLWSKGHWGKDPETMLRWRAISECVRLACPEVLGGLKYTPEEVAEFMPVAPVVRARAERAQAEAETVEAPEKPVIDDDTADGFARDILEVTTADQLDKLAARLAKWELNGHRERLLTAWTERRNALATEAPAEEPTHDEAVETLQDALEAELVEP